VDAFSATPTDQRYRLFFRTIVSNLPLAGGLLTLGLLAVYFVLPAWQLLASAGVSLVATFSGGIAYLLFKRNRNNAALMIVAFFATAMLVGHALFFSNQLVFFLAAVWIAPLFLVWNSTPDNRLRIIAPVTSLFATGAILWIERSPSLPRLDASSLDLLRWLVPLTAMVVGALAIVLVTRTVYTHRLYRRLMVSFLVIILIPLVTIIATTSMGSIQVDRQYAINSLESIAAQKNDSLTFWLEEMKYDLRAIPLNTDTGRYITSLLANSAAGQFTGTEKVLVIAQLKQAVAQTGRLDEIQLLDLNGTVLASSDPKRLNKNYWEEEFFSQGRMAGGYTSPLYFKDADEISLFISMPILDARGQTIGVLAGRANMRTPTQIMANRAGIGKTGQIYFLSSNYEVLNGTITGQPTDTVKTAASIKAISEKSNGYLLYTNERGIPVVGAYRWIPELKSVILTELDQKEAFGSVGYVLTTNIIIAILATALTLVGAVLTIRTINRPISQLVETARQVSQGNLSARMEIEREDELGTLAETINNTTAQMQELLENLEQRVNERTRHLERRTREIQSAAQIARDASTARNVEDLLNRSARLISERFGFYHVGIFLLDERNEYALLSAAAGEAGKLMIANKHKLKVGEVGIVGYVTMTGESRVALDTGEDAVHFRNPLLPYTHSEMALPLKIGSRVIGALDVQSEKANAFDQEDAETMRILADQIAVAIERTRLLQQLESAIAQMEMASQEYSGRAWREFTMHTRSGLGYRYRGIKAEPLQAPPPESLEAQVKGTTIIQKDSGKGASTIAVPVKLRGQTLGVLHLRFLGGEIPSQTIAVVEEAANRLALALENARLVQDARRLAAREKQVNIITSQVQRATDIDTVLQTAVRELGNTLGVPKTFIQIGFSSPDGNPIEKTEKG
jgi:GAF domain-containing protein/HAMP domain-containing protein